jgi:hypothetical protein
MGVRLRDRALASLGVVAMAAGLGLVGTLVEAPALSVQVHDAYFIVAWGLGPATFLTVLVFGALVLGYRAGDRGLVLRLSPILWVAYVVVKSLSWIYANRLTARLPRGDLYSFRIVGPAGAFMGVGPILGLLCGVSSIILLTRYVRAGRTLKSEGTA